MKVLQPKDNQTKYPKREDAGVSVYFKADEIEQLDRLVALSASNRSEVVRQCVAYVATIEFGGAK